MFYFSSFYSRFIFFFLFFYKSFVVVNFFLSVIFVGNASVTTQDSQNTSQKIIIASKSEMTKGFKNALILFSKVNHRKSTLVQKILR